MLLLGAGHAHLTALANARDYARHRGAVTVVTPDRFWYSGLATGMLGGEYDADSDCVDIEALAAPQGVQVVPGEARRIDPAARTVELLGGAVLEYDVLSLNLGSVVPPLRGERGHPRVFPVKPIANLWALRELLSAEMDTLRERGARTACAAPGESASPGKGPPGPDDALRVVVAGGGATGCEVAANVTALARRRGGRIAVTIITPALRLLEQWPAAAAREVGDLLNRRGVELRFGTRIEHVGESSAVLTNGDSVAFTALVNATGLTAPPLIAASGLDVDDEGALLVDEHLRSLSDPYVFGGGDCITIDGRPLPRVGVYAVRQAPVLHRNLLATLAGSPTRAFRPQRHYLSIMNLGDGTGLAVRSRLWWRGRSAHALKDFIDRRFVSAYRLRSGPRSDPRS